MPGGECGGLLAQGHGGQTCVTARHIASAGQLDYSDDKKRKYVHADAVSRAGAGEMARPLMLCHVQGR